MKYISVCSGIEAATVAWHGFGWEPVAFAEIEPFPSAVLAHHYPDVPNLGDMTAFKEWQVDAFDVLVGGTPCQAFSVAGLRQSLDDARGNLSLIFCEMADHFNPPYILWENVPGVLNTKDNAFGCFLAGLAGEDVPLVAPGGKWTDAGFVLGPKRAVAWRVLDAQYFGLAQRRRRVFVVACPRNGADPCEILFEREGVQRHSAPSREKGEGVAHDVAPCVGASGRGFERAGETRGQAPVVAVSPTLRAGGNRTGGDRPPGTDVDTADSLIIQGDCGGEAANPLRKSGCYVGKAPFAVRRLTCEECEFLQGFPRNYTRIPWRNKPTEECPDGPRYKALGNSMAVPVMRWIGKRIEKTQAG